MPNKVDKELLRYQGLPQHLKRVQVNSNCESYLPHVMIKTKQDLGKDIMWQILEVFQRHWDSGNPWMVHLFTKSHFVVKHLDLLAAMRHQVQVELTIPTLHEGMRRKFEGHSPSVKRRLQAVEKLSRAGVFVRVMAMPLFRRQEAERIRKIGFEYGAKGFKDKGFHYWGEGNVLDEDPVRTKGPEYFVDWDLFIKSGEQVLEQGHPRIKRVVMPTPKWREFEEREMAVGDSGYSELNDVDWGYIV
jgi:hypothetical protein